MVTALAAVAVWCALLVPDDASGLLDGTGPLTLLRLPVEGLALAALLLLLPRRAVRPVAVVAGTVLGLVLLLTAVNTGFHEVFDRPVRLLSDPAVLGGGMDYLTATSGRPVAVAVAVLSAVIAAALPVLLAGAGLHLAGRLRRAVGDRPGVPRAARPARVATAALTGLAVLWAGLFVTDVRPLPDRPLAARSAVDAVVGQVVAVQQQRREAAAFRRSLAPAAGAAVPAGTAAGDPLGVLRGKDVVLAFVESYGRSAVEDPRIAPEVTTALTDGQAELAAAGFSARSGFLTSPTVGGLSWLPHATLLSGTWVDDQGRYDDLLASDHGTLVRDFADAGWRTVGVLPSTKDDWPEGAFYGFDRIYLTGDLGYRGPRFGWSLMPDQHALSAIRARELATVDRRPLFVELELSSSHKPWAPLPEPVPWDAVGDGSVFGPMPDAGVDPRDIAGDADAERAQYARAVAYTLRTLTSFVTRFGDDDTVLVLLGDHQPLPELLDDDAGRDVPITIVSRDPAVLDGAAGWGWTAGMRPAPDAPVQRMDGFRQRFVETYRSTHAAPGSGRVELCHADGAQPDPTHPVAACPSVSRGGASR